MKKTYASFMDEISADQLYEGLLGYGLFSDKLPDAFSSQAFFQYCRSPISFAQGEHDYIDFTTARNNGFPRQMGIPNPMAYQRLCKELSEHWVDLQTHFHQYTDSQQHIISRIHIRKRKESQILFEMSYENWKEDGTPEDDLPLGNHFVVHADISTCFPSIYTHSLCWAIVGKEQAKSDRKSGWHNNIDKLCQNMRNGETHGLMIGPHASNLLSEIILVVIDAKLYARGWRFIRNIDDYTCFVHNCDDAQKFINDLIYELKQFDLPLNHKKTSVESLPVPSVEHWVNKLNTFHSIPSRGEINYKRVKAFFDLAITSMRTNNGNAAALKYVIKVLSGAELTENAKQLFVKKSMELAIAYPYLLHIMDQYVFSMGYCNTTEIDKFANTLFSEASEQNNAEGVYYAIYFAIKYHFEISGIQAVSMVNHDSCLVRLFAMLYYKKRSDLQAMKLFRDDAKRLATTDMDKWWIYVYETLTYGNLKGEWKPMKKAGVSFIKI